MSRRPSSLPLVLVLVGACAGPGATDVGAAPTAAGETGGPATSNDPIVRELDRMWSEAGVEPSPLASDAEFIRRASLDLIGRVPTREEVGTFVDSETRDKRGALVDQLLASEAHAEYWASLWANELLPGGNQAQRSAGEALESYFTTVLSENRPWSSVVEDLLAAEGMVADDMALAYLGARKLRGQTRDEALAELNSTTARVFLGSQIECAQCHDHPYVPEFTRQDFWAQAAYFGRTNVKVHKDKQADKAKAEKTKAKDASSMEAMADEAKTKNSKKRAELEVRERSKGELRLALDPSNPRKEAIAPRFLGDDGSSLDPDEPRRLQLSRSIIANPRFAEATVGWVWTQLLGAGIVEPWDDLLGERERPALLAELAGEFRTSGHDIRALIKAVVLSPAYQRSSAGPSEASEAEIAKAEAVFARAPVRPLSAEQLFASLLTVTGIEEVGGRAFRRAVRGKKQTALREYEFVFTDDEMGAADGFSGNVPQALLLLNGGLTNEGVVARPGSSLDRILAASADTDARLAELWRTVYARGPRAEELELGRQAVAAGGTEAWEDLMFAMIYSSEFGSNH